MATKYKVTVGALVILAVLFLGDAYLRTRSAAQKTSELKTAVSAMSLQQLAAASKECDEALSLGGRAKHDAAYCAEVFRAIEDQPLQMVEVPK